MEAIFSEENHNKEACNVIQLYIKLWFQA
jgi:hypothetical protein